MRCPPTLMQLAERDGQIEPVGDPGDRGFLVILRPARGGRQAPVARPVRLPSLFQLIVGPPRPLRPAAAEPPQSRPSGSAFLAWNSSVVR